MAVETSGNILVTSGPNGVGRFSKLGAQIGAFSKGDLQFPFGIVRAPNGDLFVSDLALFPGSI